MSKEYIEKEAALNILKELHAEAESPSAAEELFKAHERIGDINPADVKPVVRGEWLATVQPCGWHEIRCATCSKCGEDYPLGGGEFSDVVECWHFCPNCGAEMEVKDD